MKLRKVQLKNFRCFDEFEMEFAQEHNLHVLIAPNMVGKSALLQALSISVGGFLRNIASPPRIEYTDHRIIGENPIANVARQCAIIATVTLQDAQAQPQETEWIFTHAVHSSEDSYRAEEGEEIPTQLYDAVAEEARGILPLLMFSGTDYLYARYPDHHENPPHTGSIDHGYWNCLTHGDKLGLVLDWLGYVDDIFQDQAHHAGIARKWFGDVPSNSFELFTKVVQRLLPDIQEIQFITTRGRKAQLQEKHHQSHREPVFSFTSGDVRTFSQLSEGFRYLVILAGELTVRSFLLNKHLGVEVNQSIPGVVLIDEFGIHLHPDLQSKALQRLSQEFPHVQFIITTHSPMLLNGLRKEQVHIMELEEDGKRTVRHPERDIIGMGAEGILLEVFGLETTFDEETVIRIGELQALSQKQLTEGLSETERKSYDELVGATGALGYDSSLKDPLYRKFLAKYRELQSTTGTPKGFVMRAAHDMEVDMDRLVEEAIRELLE